MKPARLVTYAWVSPRTRLAALPTVVVWVIAAALLFPAAFPLLAPNPAWVLGVELPGDEHEDHAAPHQHDTDEHAKAHAYIPGAPDHPADHGCTPCKVLKDQASYVASVMPVVAVRVPPLVSPADRTVSQHSGNAVPRPRSRAPPSSPAY